MDHQPAYNPFGVVESWRVDGGDVVVKIKPGAGSLTLAAAAAVRKFADDASSAFISDMLRRYTEADVARANARFVDFRLRLEAEMAAKFSPLTAYSKRNGYVLLRADENGDITIGSEQGGRFAAGVTEHTMDPVQERAKFSLVAGTLEAFDAYLVTSSGERAESFALSGLDIDADVIRDSLAGARAGKVSMRLHLASDGRTADETDFDAAVKPFESDLHHTNRHQLIAEFAAAAGIFYALVDRPDGDDSDSLTALWKTAVERKGEPLRFTPKWHNTLLESPAAKTPANAHDFSTRMRLCITDALVNRRNMVTLEPTSVSAPVLYELPVADFSVTRDGWALGNYPMLSLDVFFALVDMLTRCVTGLEASGEVEHRVPVELLEDRFYESFHGFHWSNSRVVGRTVWAVAMNQMAEGLIGFTAKLDMVGEPLWIPYQDTTEVATLFRIMLEAAPTELGGATRPLVVEGQVLCRGRSTDSASTRCSAKGYAAKTTDYLRVESEVVRYLHAKLANTRKSTSRLAPLKPTIIGILKTKPSHQLASALGQMMLSMAVYDKVRSDGGSKQRYTHALAVTAATIGDLAVDILFRL